jgi:membrane-associated phospholipid phosphatase
MSVSASWAFASLASTHGLLIWKKGTRTFWKIHVVLLPAVIIPVYVCGDRVRSGNHTPFQVLFGAGAGAACALLVFLTMDRTTLREG